MANKKRQKEIESMILNLLEKNKNNYYSLKDLSSLLPLRKHEHKELNEIMNNLKREKRVSLKHKQFGISSGRKSQRVTGKFDSGSLVRGYSYAFVLSPQGDIFVDSEDISNAYNNDEVLVEIKYRRKGMLYGKILKVEKRANTHLSGDIDHYQGRYYFIPDLEKIHTTFEVSDLAGAKEKQKVLLEIIDWGNRDLNIKPHGKVVEILGEAGDTRIEELSLIKQFELPLSFPEEVLRETEKLQEEIPAKEIKRRKDFRSLLTFTIDPVTAKDYDDAISLVVKDNKYILYVHIADVTYYINTDSNLFNEAVNRGNSFYFPRTVIPMLPEKISNKICSLRPDEDKLTMTVITEFDAKLNILDQSVCESVIRSSFRLNYEEVDQLFEGGEQQLNEGLVSVLQELRRISKDLTKRRYDKGYIPFNMPDTVFHYDEEGNISAITRTRETESHKLIENCMLLANEYTASLLNKKASQSIYRIHEEPDESSVDKILKLLTYYKIKYKKNQKTPKLIQKLLLAMPNENYHRVFDPLILRSMKKARYDTIPVGHFGLAMENYTHFTSPIRRICDLTVHHLIRQEIWKQQKRKEIKKKKLQEIADNASERELLADNAERETRSRFKKLYMKDKVGETYQGLIVSMNNNNLIIELNSIPVSGLIPLSSLTDDDYSFYSRYMEVIGKKGKRVFRLLDKVTVRLERIDFDLIFSLIE
jgi:ribonuclease R